MDNLEEMDKFLERYNLPRLNQEEIKFIVKNLSTTKPLGTDGFSGKFSQIFKE